MSTGRAIEGALARLSKRSCTIQRRGKTGTKRAASAVASEGHLGRHGGAERLALQDEAPGVDAGGRAHQREGALGDVIERALRGARARGEPVARVLDEGDAQTELAQALGEGDAVGDLFAVTVKMHHRRSARGAGYDQDMHVGYALHAGRMEVPAAQPWQPGRARGRVKKGSLQPVRAERAGGVAQGEGGKRVHDFRGAGRERPPL
jgi:hypothetical protein